MSDYLANLVARNLEVAERVEPRIASSFEPAADARTRHSPFREPTAAEPLEQDVFVERSPDQRNVPTSHAPGTAGSGTSRAARSGRGAVASSTPAAPTPPSITDREPIQHAPQAIPSGEPSSPPRRAKMAPTAAAAGAVPPSAITRRVDHAGPSRPMPARDPNVTPLAPSTAADRPNKARSRRPRSETFQDRASTGLPVGVTVTLSPDQSLAARAHLSSGTAKVEAAGPQRSTVSSTAVQSESVSREAAQPTASAAVAPARQEIGERSLHGASPAVAASSRHSEGARSALPVHVRLQTATTTQSLADRVLDHTSGVAGSPAAPTVHVTIGRLEVKATPAARPSPRTPPAPAASTSLDDYLRTRTDGSRR